MAAPKVSAVPAWARQLARRRAAARAVLWAERLARLLWAPAAILAAAAALALLGAIDALSGWLHLVLLAAGLAAAGAASVRAARTFRIPSRAEAERRLEQDSGLRHQPLAVLRDRAEAAGGGAGATLWRVHLGRAQAAIAALRLRGPRPQLASGDPYALRALAALLLLTGLVVAGPQAGPRTLRALLPDLQGGSGVAPILQAWIEPPAYTGMAPIFLPPGGSAADAPPVEIPMGSRLTVSVTGGRFAPHLSLDGGRIKIHTLGEASWHAQTPLTRGGRLSLTRLFGEIAHWDIAVVANDPPDVSWTALPTKAETSLETRFPWRVAQRWGVASLAIEMRPAGRPDLPPVRLPVPLPGTPKSAAGTFSADLARDPYAGVDMTARLDARDVSGQTSQSPPAKFILPAREFHNPLARAIIELRRRLALHPDTGGDAAEDLDALAQMPAPTAAKPDDLAGQSGLFLNMVAVSSLLRADATAGFAEAEDRLYTVALALDGALPDPSQQALDAARDSLRRALDDRAHGRGTPSELARKLEALRQALDQRLADIAKQAARDGKLPPGNAHQHLAVPSLDRMIRQLEQAAREGRLDDAKQRLAQLEKLLNQLKDARVMSPEEAARAMQQTRAGRQMKGAVQDLARREGGLMDRGQARAPRPQPALPPRFRVFPDPNAPDPDAPTSAQSEAAQADRHADARTEQALRRALDALRQGFGAMGYQPPRNLDDAGRAMQEAQDALARGNDAQARAAEGRAVAALQKGGQDMARQMQQNSRMAIVPGGSNPGEEGPGQEGAGEPADDQEGDQDGKRDPLGRPTQGTGGQANDDRSVRVPDEMEQGRSRALQQELRRRGADRERRQQELDYIDRLLKPF